MQFPPRSRWQALGVALVALSCLSGLTGCDTLSARFRARDGVKSQYVTGKEPHLKRWINIPHIFILAFDAVIIVMAVRVWVKVKQTMPPADDTEVVLERFELLWPPPAGG